MNESLPKLDRDALRQAMRVELEKAVEEVANAVDEAPTGRIIRDSEEPVRDTMDRFRQLMYEKALQLKLAAAEAAFPPSGQHDRPAATE